jgi:hypothetical protein
MAEELQHQRSETEYRIRINGGAVAHSTEMHKTMMDEFAQICAENPDDYVDIVSISISVLIETIQLPPNEAALY